MAPDPGSFDPRRLTRRQLLKAIGLGLGAPGLARPVYGLEGAWIDRA